MIMLLHLLCTYCMYYSSSLPSLEQHNLISLCCCCSNIMSTVVPGPSIQLTNQVFAVSLLRDSGKTLCYKWDTNPHFLGEWLVPNPFDSSISNDGPGETIIMICREQPHHVLVGNLCVMESGQFEISPSFFFFFLFLKKVTARCHSHKK